MIKDLFWCLMIYLLYRFVFEFLVPVGRTFWTIKKNISKMQQQQQPFNQPPPFQQEPQHNNPNNSVKHTPNAANNGDYIDFEEIKD